MISNFMKTKSAVYTGLCIGAFGLLTSIFNFDPVQFTVSCALIVSEISIYFDMKKED